MTGLGLIVLYLGYAVGYWAIQAFQGNDQDSFVSYIFPFAPKNTGVQGVGGVANNSSNAPAPTVPPDQAKANSGKDVPGVQRRGA